MLTRCPACATHFRVTPDQLKARSGRVRCGECQHVFNALDSLIEEPVAVVARGQAPAFAGPVAGPGESRMQNVRDEAADAPSPAAAQDAAPEIAVPPAPTLVDGSAPETDAPGSADAPEKTASAVAESPAAPIEAEESPSAPIAEAAETETTVAGEGVVPPDSGEAVITGWTEVAPPPARRWLWIAGSLLALAALAWQATLAFRVEIAVLAPELRPTLGALCEVAGCEVGLPAKIAQIGIEASDLHPDTARPGRLMLSATLKNRAPFAQQYPHLELTLTDTADQAVARKVLVPADYLPPKTAAADGMPPNADIVVGVGIDAGELPASGYRLYLFYP